MYLVGLTGGIASGKSTVAQLLCHRGFELIDADQIAREVVLPGTQTWKKVVEHFGSEVLDENGFIDRPALGRVVFSDASRRALLNELTHPPVIDEIANSLELLTAFDGVVMLDVPLLVEAGVSRGYESVVVVAASPETQALRLCRDRGLDPTAAQARIAAQSSLQDKLAVATHVIWNDGSRGELQDEVDRIADDLLRRAKDKTDSETGRIPND